MTFTITERDKKLLSILAVVLIAALFIKFLIIPQLEAKSDLASESIEVDTQAMEMKLAIDTKGTLEEKLKDADEEFVQRAADYYPMMQSYEIEALITKMILNNGMESRDLEVSSKSYVAEVNPYFASTMGLEMAMTAEGGEDSGSTDSGSSDGAQSVEQTQSTVYASQVNVTVTGTLKQAKHLIDVVNQEYPSVRIQTFHIDSEAAETTEGAAVDMTTLDLGLEVYMCEK